MRKRFIAVFLEFFLSSNCVHLALFRQRLEVVCDVVSGRDNLWYCIRTIKMVLEVVCEADAHWPGFQ